MYLKLSEVPEHTGWVMQVAFSSPVEATDGQEPDGFVPLGQVEGFQLPEVMVQVIHFQEQHAVVDPVPDIGILEVKAQVAGMEIG